MLKPRVRQNKTVEASYLDEGCFIRELSNTIEDPDVSIAEARVPAGVTTEWHQLRDTSERYVITSGAGVVEIGEQPAEQVGPVDVVLIPPGCAQRIHNPGDDDLVFLAICTPRFQPEVYQSLAHRANSQGQSDQP